MSDPTENIRRELVNEINSNPNPREELEKQYGKEDVFSTEEVREKFEVLGFMAPFVVVRHKGTNKKGSLMFQHNPRIYFGYKED